MSKPTLPEYAAIHSTLDGQMQALLDRIEQLEAALQKITETVAEVMPELLDLPPVDSQRMTEVSERIAAIRKETE